MGFISDIFSPKAPSVPAPPPIPPAATPPSLANAAASTAMQQKAKAAGAMAQGYDGTVATSPLGAGTPNTAKPSLLGGA